MPDVFCEQFLEAQRHVEHEVGLVRSAALRARIVTAMARIDDDARDAEAELTGDRESAGQVARRRSSGRQPAALMSRPAPRGLRAAAVAASLNASAIAAVAMGDANGYDCSDVLNRSATNSCGGAGARPVVETAGGVRAGAGDAAGRAAGGAGVGMGAGAGVTGRAAATAGGGAGRTAGAADSVTCGAEAVARKQSMTRRYGL